MLTDITIGQFFPGTSVLHRMDPRAKLLLLLVLMAAIFVFDTKGGYAALTALGAVLAVSSGVPVGMYWRSLRPLWWILAFTFLIHLCSTPGTVFCKIWMFSLTWEGLEKGFFLCLRLALLILFSSLLTFTTSPLSLTDGMERLLRPLRVVGVPAHELAMMMTIALRFVPTLIEETDKIMKAQQSRGADFATGNIVKRMKHLIPILVPLFISSFRRADELAIAMEARCYRGGEGRTRMKELRVGGVDYAAAGVTALLLAAMGAMKMAGI
ncbi:MAG: energy-coupling factor transporter transmembrane protein EcfT [Schwartzia sp.]|nr:energy-coupling factor transporter transmembrane protein EcfT [Schwartzia sp. (in: firmicutes)]